MNYVKAYLHANGNNQIMGGILRMQKTNCIISGERDFSQIIRDQCPSGACTLEGEVKEPGEMKEARQGSADRTRCLGTFPRKKWNRKHKEPFQSRKERSLPLRPEG